MVAEDDGDISNIQRGLRFSASQAHHAPKFDTDTKPRRWRTVLGGKEGREDERIPNSISVASA